MKKTVYSLSRLSALLSGLLLAGLFVSCSSLVEEPTGASEPELGWLFTGRAPYTLETKVNAAPGPATFMLVTDLSLMADTPDIVLKKEVTISPDSVLKVDLGQLDPGFYEIRLRDSVRFNIGVRPDAVVSPPDAQPDFDAFWAQNLSELAKIPMDAVYTPIPECTNQIRACYEVRYTSLDGAQSGGVISIPVAKGKYPVCIQYMGYGAPVFYFDPYEHPDRIDFLVSVRDQGIFKDSQQRWIDRGLSSKETFYYRGAFCDARRAVDFVASLDKADPDRIVSYGESQGGALTFVAAALDSRIKAIAPAVPFLGDYPDYARIVWWPVHEVFAQADQEGLDRDALMTMLSYFDVKNFASRIHCPVYMAFGLQDPTCPPHTNFAIYNNLGTRDKRFLCIPTCGHAMWQEPAWDAERSGFLSKYLSKPNNQ